MDNSLAYFLNNLNKNALQRIARAHKLPNHTRKAQLIETLFARLCNPQIITELVQAMTPLTQKIFERLQTKGGRATTLGLLMELERGGVLKPQPRSWQPPQPEMRDPHQPFFADLLWPLLQHGLVFLRAFVIDTPDALTRHDMPLVIPSEIMKALSGLGRPLQTMDADGFERTTEGLASNFQRDVYLYWNYVREHEVLLTVTGLVPKRHLLKLNDMLIAKSDLKMARDEADLSRLNFIRIVMEEAGLLKSDATQLMVSSSASDFWSYSLMRRTDRLFEAWKKATQWNELLHLPIEPQTNGNRSPRAVVLVAKARQWLLNLLAEHVRDGWLSLDDLVKKARALNYEFLFPRERKDFGAINPYYYYHNPLGWGFPVGDESEGWEKVEAEFIRNLIQEPLHWLGLVSLGYRHEQVVAFQLTPVGAYLFGLAAQPPLDDTTALSGRVVVQPNFQIFALEPIAEQTLAMLDRFADRVKADRVMEYHLSRESFYRATQNGLTAQAVIDFLTQATATPLPQNVHRSLEDWAQGFERITIRKRVSLLHTHDAALLDELAAIPDLAPWWRGRPLPYVAIVHHDDEARERILQELFARGQLPALTCQPPSPHTALGQATTYDEASHALVLDEQGKIQLLHSIPNIFLLRELEQHVERRPDGLYLTEAVVKANRAAGESLDDILARWTKWHHGALPPAWQQKLKQWGQFYGSARIEQLVVIRLQSAELLHKLMNDPTVAAHLKPFAGDAAAAIVDATHLETVKQWLEAHGVPVE
jgi:hypothetical protein